MTLKTSKPLHVSSGSAGEVVEFFVPQTKSHSNISSRAGQPIWTNTHLYISTCELISVVFAFADLRGNLQTGVFIQWFGQQTGGYYTSCSSPSQSIAAHPHCTHQTRVSTYTRAHNVVIKTTQIVSRKKH